MKALLQKQLKAKLGEAEALRKGAEAKGQWSEADAKAYEAKLGEADALKGQLALVGKEEEIRDWAHSSKGSYVLGAHNAAGDDDGEDDPELKSLQDEYWRTAGPTEGTASGVAMKNGELYATSKAGERKLAVIKSGAYKDAQNAYLRNCWKPDYRPSVSAIKVLQSGQDSAGGSWVTPEVLSTINKKTATMTTIYPNATTITVGKDLATFPKVVYTTDDKYTSGVRFNWTGQAPSATPSESTNPAAGRTQIPVHTATAYIIVTRQQMEDNDFDLMGMLSELLGESFALGQEDAYVNADGVGKPQGVLKHPNISVAHASGGMYVASGSASAIAWGTDGVKGVTGLEAALPPQYEPNAAWYGSKATYGALRALNTGGAGMQWTDSQYYGNPSMGLSPNLLGYPVKKAQFFPTIAADAYPLVHGDMKGYWIVERVGVTIEVLREIRALDDEVVLYARMRKGGQLVQPWRLKALKIATS